MAPRRAARIEAGRADASVASRTATRRRRLLVAVGLTIAVVALEAIGGGLTHSMGLVADAGHNLADGAGLVLTFVALRVSLRSPTKARSFGYHRATILTAVANVGVLAVVTVLVAIEAVERLVHPVAIESLPVVAIAVVSLVANALGAAVLAERAELSMRASALHLGADALASAGVALTGLVEWLTGGWYRLDGAVSLLIAVAIGIQAARIVRAAVEVLLEATPADLSPDEIRAAITAHPGVLEVHDLHCWSLSSEVRALSAHLVLSGHPSLEAAQVTGEAVKQDLRARFRLAHATLELECEPCVGDDEASCAFEPVAAHRPR